MTEPSVCILVLNWNGAEDTLACLDSLSKISYSGATTVVIDNGSTDASRDLIKAAYPEITVIELPENLLFGGGNNAGLAWAAEQHYDYVIFLNNDTLVEPDFVEPLVAAFENYPETGVAGPLICYADTPDLIWYGGGIVNLWSGVVAHRFIRNRSQSAGNATIPTEYVTGCCMMLPTDLAVSLGGFDPLFTMYGEDVDLSLRSVAAARPLLFVPASRIYHKVSASVGGEFGGRKLKRKALGLIRLYERHARWYQWITILLSQLVLSANYAFIYVRHGLMNGNKD